MTNLFEKAYEEFLNTKNADEFNELDKKYSKDEMFYGLFIEYKRSRKSGNKYLNIYDSFHVGDEFKTIKYLKDNGIKYFTMTDQIFTVARNLIIAGAEFGGFTEVNYKGFILTAMIFTIK